MAHVTEPLPRVMLIAMEEHGAGIFTMVLPIVVILFSLVVTILPLVFVFRWISKMKRANHAMGRVQPGATVPVRFNPGMPSQVTVDFRAMGFV